MAKKKKLIPIGIKLKRARGSLTPCRQETDPPKPAPRKPGRPEQRLDDSTPAD